MLLICNSGGPITRRERNNIPVFVQGWAIAHLLIRSSLISAHCKRAIERFVTHLLIAKEQFVAHLLITKEQSSNLLLICSLQKSD